MLRKTVLGGCLFLVLGFSFLAIYVQRALHQSQITQLEPYLLTADAGLDEVAQYRLGVTKDLWMVEGRERLHHRICSGYSLVKVCPRRREGKLVEQLRDVSAVVQEKIERLPGKRRQQLRFIRTKQAMYNYSSHTFFSEWVELALARIEGVELPLERVAEKECYAKAMAQEATFFFLAPTPKLQAKMLWAKIESE